MILDIQPDLKVSKQRCEALIIGVLRRNEVDGSTRLYANDLFYYIKEEYDAKELLPMLKDVAVESDLIYYDEKTKDLSIMSTYLAECKIADFVKSKIQNSKNIESSLWKKVPNSIDLTEIYKGKNSLLLNFSPNKNKILPQLNNKKHEDKIIAIRQIFLKFSGCLSF